MVYNCDWAVCKQSTVSEHREWLNKRTDGTAEHRGFFCTVGSPPVLSHHYDNTLMFLQHTLLSIAPLGAPHCQAEDHLCGSNVLLVFFLPSSESPVRLKSQFMKHLWGNTYEERRGFLSLVTKILSLSKENSQLLWNVVFSTPVFWSSGVGLDFGHE